MTTRYEQTVEDLVKSDFTGIILLLEHDYYYMRAEFEKGRLTSFHPVCDVKSTPCYPMQRMVGCLCQNSDKIYFNQRTEEQNKYLAHCACESCYFCSCGRFKGCDKLC